MSRAPEGPAHHTGHRASTACPVTPAARSRWWSGHAGLLRPARRRYAAMAAAGTAPAISPRVSAMVSSVASLMLLKPSMRGLPPPDSPEDEPGGWRAAVSCAVSWPVLP